MKTSFCCLFAALVFYGCSDPWQPDMHFVKLIPQFYSGTLGMSPNGTLDSMSFHVRTSYSFDAIYQFWDFGDGTSGGFVQEYANHIFPHPGAYHVRVDVYRTDGTFVGRDTATITILFPDFSVDSLKNKKIIEMFLVLDTNTFSLSDPVKFPIGLGIGVIEWNGNDFLAEYNYSYKYFRIKGRVTSDGKSIESLSVFATDSIANPYLFSYSFDILSIPLTGVSGNFIYKLSDLMPNDLENINFIGNIDPQFEGSINVIDEISFFGRPDEFRQLPPSECIVVFRNE